MLVLTASLLSSTALTEAQALLKEPRVKGEWVVEVVDLARVRFPLNVTVIGRYGRYFAIRSDDATALALLDRPDVVAVIPNLLGRLAGVQTATGGAFSAGLDRIDQRQAIGANRSYEYSTTGRAVTVYVVDDAAFVSHADFATLPWEKATFGARTVINAYDATLGAGAGMQTAHGTQMSSIAGGLRGGVAKGATIKVIDVVRNFVVEIAPGVEDVIRAITWIKQNHVPGTPGVVNMSFTFPANAVIDSAVAELSSVTGLTVVAAAGNDGRDASEFSPARAESVITVGNLNELGTTRDSIEASSNYGPAVDLFAPGVSIVAAATTGSADYGAYPDGSSQSAAHVTGVVARYLENFPAATPAAVRTALLAAATTGAMTGSLPTGTPNRIVFSDFTSTRVNVVARLGTARDDAAAAVAFRSIGGVGVRAVAGNRNSGGSTWPCSLTFGSEGFISKVVDETVVWSTTLPAPGTNCGPKDYTTVAAVAIDSAGDFFAAVNFSSAPFSGSSYAQSAVYRLSGVTGEVIWVRMVGANLSAGSRIAVVDALSRIVLVGYTQDPIPGTTAVGGVDVFLAAFDGSGAMQWARKFGSPGLDLPSAVVVSGGGVFVGGFTSNVITEARSLTGGVASSAGGNDAFVAEVRADGAPGRIARVLQFGGAGDDRVAGLDIQSGGFVAAGTTNSMLAAPRGGGGLYDAFVVGLTTTLTMRWGLQQFGSSADDYAVAVHVSPMAGEVFVGGFTAGSLGFGVNPGGQDVFVSKYAADGSFRWDWQNLVPGEQKLSGITSNSTFVDGPAPLFIVGSTDGNSWAGSPLGGWDAFSATLEGL